MRIFQSLSVCGLLILVTAIAAFPTPMVEEAFPKAADKTTPENSDKLKYENKRCGISFTHPEDYEVIRYEDLSLATEECELTLQPKNLDESADDGFGALSIHLVVMQEGFENAAREGGFEGERKDWIALGRMGRGDPADYIQSKNWDGILAVATTGCHHPQGGYVGLCDNPRALLHNRKKLSAVLSGDPGTWDLLQEIIQSFRFIEGTVLPKIESKRTFKYYECGVQFTLPGRWKVRKLDTDEKQLCRLTATPISYAALLKKQYGLKRYALQIAVTRSDFMTAAKNNFFHKEEARWIFTGGAKNKIASPFVSNRIVGIKVIFEESCPNSERSNNRCVSYRAVFNNHANLSVSARCRHGALEAYDALYGSLEFLSP